MLTKLAQAIVDTVNAAQAQDPAKLGTSIVDIVQNGVGIVGKLFGF
ncbi:MULTISPECIES: beta-class phenol-soluble modulin [Staphylococcus]|uniref:Beta-class phenol-soluble modulin n=3 Tax=Staphylococcus TaxID=1279 RepID=A0A3S4T0L0_9STAP|nr:MULTISPECIES: beta-class phenol-soluble modulin [Staphylococcus]ANZ33626.1 hemolytic protein [Staphylococcus carnosus]KKB26542.1 antibacterial protein 1 [Staphylococcus carnosus]MDK8645142.1 beta-class phenol-soluble modulin [Staphylococcus condimenti]PNZ61761.1 beta-class phenol-soluble modulin [Staphylococcus condimenti]POA06552.1 beta-class phenol-soluble modulin [Staphylococcus carnosus]